MIARPDFPLAFVVAALTAAALLALTTVGNGYAVDVQPSPVECRQ